MENKINNFIDTVNKRLNGIFFYHSFLSCLFISVVLCLTISMFYVLSGFKVPILLISLTFLITNVVLILFFFIYKKNREQATLFADKFFKLNDGLISSVFLLNQNRNDSIHKLQISDTVNRIENCDVKHIPFNFKIRKVFIILFVAFGLVYLLSLDDSPFVLKQKLIAETNIENSEKNKENLLKEVEALKEEMDEDQKKWLKENKILEEIKKLKPGKDLKESLKAYAKIEKKLQNLKKEFSTKADEKYLKSLAEQLKKHSTTNELGRKLSAKEYKKAADTLKKLQLKKSTKENMKSEKLAALKKISKSSSKLSKNKFKESSLSKNLKEFSESMNELSENMDAAEMEMKEMGEMSEMSECQCSANTFSVNDKLGEMCKSLSKMGAKKSFSEKMSKMMSMLAQCNSKMLGKNPGKGIGAAEGDKNLANGSKVKGLNKNDTQLKGMKNGGKSTVEIQETESGYGKSNIVSKSKEVNYKHTLESIVQREDIPEDLKQGVKEYFNSIHAKKVQN